MRKKVDDNKIMPTETSTMPRKVPRRKTSERVEIIGAVKTYLGFFVLVVLIVETVLGGLAFRADGRTQNIALYAMVFIIVFLVVVVSYFAYNKPHILLHSMAREAELRTFCDAISGWWWERITPGDSASAISLVQIRFDPNTNSIQANGTAFGPDGKPSARWETDTSCIRLSDAKVFYYWHGHHRMEPSQRFEGFGEISFEERDHRFDSAAGLFSRTNLSDFATSTRKFVTYRRITDRETEAMRKGDADHPEMSKLIRDKLKSAA
jgi:hypothetical protein